MNHDARHSLEDLLGREITAAQSLAQTLAAERTALTGDSPEAVKEQAAEKIRLFANIEELEGERRTLWGTSGADGAALGDVVANRWRKLMELMAVCRTANEVNGHIIHIRQNQIRQLFDIVRGGAPVTYGPQGKTFARSLRALARA
ncbi:MAG TPA: flagellar protein FlgN [Steroidobacteraceae bacterium]|jgi:flagellar biosynthesis/type III secretory pathway chaperone|nr:flagellar protein FlgN [Steroidobacteraceae bacterium]